MKNFGLLPGIHQNDDGTGVFLKKRKKIEKNCGNNMLIWSGKGIRWSSFFVHKLFEKILKNVLIKAEFIFEKYNFKVMQHCINTRGSNTRSTRRNTVEHTLNFFFIV